MSVIGLMRGMNFVSYQVLPFSLSSANRVMMPGQERDAEIDEDALGDLAHGDIDGRSREPEPGREDGDEDVGVDREEQDLEDRVEGDQAGRILPVPLGQVVPDDDHGDAAGQADHDQAVHVLGLVAQEDDGQGEHQERPDDPVLDERQRQDLDVLEDIPELLVFHLGQRRVHHQDEPDGDGDVGRSGLEPVDEADDGRDKIAEPDADGHGQEDPDGQVAVEELESRVSRGHARTPFASLRA